MPSKSKKQNPKFAKKVGVPVKVAKEYYAADSGTKSRGGFVGENNGSSLAMARGGSAFSSASKVTRKAGS